MPWRGANYFRDISGSRSHRKAHLGELITSPADSRIKEKSTEQILGLWKDLYGKVDTAVGGIRLSGPLLSTGQNEIKANEVISDTETKTVI